jgi:hypothetical protein
MNMDNEKEPASRQTGKQAVGRDEIQSKKSFLRPLWWLGLMVVISLSAIVVIIIIKNIGGSQSNLFKNGGEEIGAKPCTTKSAPDLTTDGITWTLPDCASDIRLIFPYSMDEVFHNLDTGLTGYGVHAGQHIEGLDHVWIDLRNGTPIRSWANGTVIKVEVSGDIQQGEIQITIDYGHNLYGIHMEVRTPMVKVGDKVTAGQIVGVGFDSGNKNNGDSVTSGEFALVDLNREDGVLDFFDHPSTVSPYDYLKEPDKTNLIAAYKMNYLEPYLAGKTVSSAFRPFQPYLTNQLMLHTDDNKGKLTGEWYGIKTDPNGDRRDCLTFIEADNSFYKGNLVFSRNDNLRNPYFGIQGTFEVDYAKNQIRITGNNPFSNQGIISSTESYYGIFIIDESGSRPTLKIEYQENSYPKDFSINAVNYILRDNGEGNSPVPQN